MKPADLEAIAFLVLLEDLAAQAPEAAEGKVRATGQEIKRPLDHEWPYHSSGSQQEIVDSPRATRLTVGEPAQPFAERNLRVEGLPLQPPEGAIKRIAQDVSDGPSPVPSGSGEVAIDADGQATPVGEGAGSRGVDAGEEVFPGAQGEDAEVASFLATLGRSNGEVLRSTRGAQGRGSPHNPMTFKAITPSRNEGEGAPNEVMEEDRGRPATSIDVPEGVPKISRGEERTRRRRVVRQEREQLELSRRVAALEEMVREGSGQHLAQDEWSYPRLSYPA